MSQLSVVIKSLQMLMEQQGDIQIEFNYAINLAQDSVIALPLARSGNDSYTSLTEYRTRRDFCLECPERSVKRLSEDRSIDLCLQCGCPLEGILKVRAKKCPLGKFS